MGCFSFLCSTCEEPINSDSFSGEHCALFLMENGVMIERMMGQYDSYGRVFDENMSSVEWESHSWGAICNLMFNNDKNSGIAAYHTECAPEDDIDLKVSNDDPDQGWGEYKYTTEGEFLHEVY